jgi:hypothetical protein
MERVRRLLDEIQCRRQWKKYPVTISGAHRYVWFRIAKCGTRTIKSLLEDLENRAIPNAARFAKFDAAKYHDYFKFAFVRNPYDRLVSCYISKIHGSDENQLSLKYWSPNLSFADFADAVSRTPDSRSNRHYRSQHTMLDLGTLDFLGRLESFENDVMVVMNRLAGRTAVSVPSLNATKRSHYSRYYDEDLRVLVGERYAEDLRLLGYDFAGSTDSAPR